MRVKGVILVAAASFVAALVVSGCTGKDSGQKAAAGSRSHEAALVKVMTAIDECSALLAELKGPEDVAGARAGIEEALGKVRSAEKELSGLPDLPAEQRKLLSAKYGPELDRRSARLGTEVARLRPEPATTKSAEPIMKEAGGRPVKETGGGSVLVDSVKDNIEAVKAKIKKKLEVRTRPGTASVRG